MQYIIDGKDFLLLLLLAALAIVVKTAWDVNKKNKRQKEIDKAMDELFERLERNMKL